jgi:hypothetical protein
MKTVLGPVNVSSRTCLSNALAAFGRLNDEGAALRPPLRVNLPVLRKYSLRELYLPVQGRTNSVDALVPSEKTAVAWAWSLPSGHLAVRTLTFLPL